MTEHALPAMTAPTPSAPSAKRAEPGLLTPMPSEEIRRWLQAPRPSEEALMIRVRAALFHGWTPNLSLEEEDMILADWLDDVAEFPTWTLTAAFRTWRREHPTRRPAPGGIRALCMAEVRRLTSELQKREVARPVEDDAVVAPRADPAVMARIVAEAGFERAGSKPSDDAPSGVDVAQTVIPMASKSPPPDRRLAEAAEILREMQRQATARFEAEGSKYDLGRANAVADAVAVLAELGRVGR